MATYRTALLAKISCQILLSISSKFLWITSYKASFWISAFQLRTCSSMTQFPLPELLQQRYRTKNYSAYLQKLLWITSNIKKLLSECQILAAFQSRIHRSLWRCPLSKHLTRTSLQKPLGLSSKVHAT